MRGKLSHTICSFAGSSLHSSFGFALLSSGAMSSTCRGFYSILGGSSGFFTSLALSWACCCYCSLFCISWINFLVSSFFCRSKMPLLIRRGFNSPFSFCSVTLLPW